MPSARAVLAWILAGLLAPAWVDAAGCSGATIRTAIAATAAPWSRLPPTGREAAEVPQIVTITFDDNFGVALPGSVGGVGAIVDAYAARRNPAGKGIATDFDGGPIRATFFSSSIYMTESSETVLGGSRGEDQGGRNRAAWKAALAAGHEMADHTVNHLNGGTATISEEDCCRPRDWSVEQWSVEIAACRTALADPRLGLGANDVVGFRAPYLSYNDHLFTALQELGFAYDSSLPNCFDDAEDGTNCSWPYALDRGSPDAEVLARKLAQRRPQITLPAIKGHPGLWELPVTTLIVPPDSAAGTYRFKIGLRERIAARAPLPYPTIYEPSSGKITGFDYALLIDAGLSGDEMRAILEYNLDLHLSGNRSPLIFVAHAHLYAFSTPEDNPDTPSEAEREARWKGLTEFIDYAMAKPDVRIVAARNIVEWMHTILSGKR